MLVLHHPISLGSDVRSGIDSLHCIQFSSTRLQLVQNGVFLSSVLNGRFTNTMLRLRWLPLILMLAPCRFFIIVCPSCFALFFGLDDNDHDDVQVLIFFLSFYLGGILFWGLLVSTDIIYLRDALRGKGGILNPEWKLHMFCTIWRHIQFCFAFLFY